MKSERGEDAKIIGTKRPALVWGIAIFYWLLSTFRILVVAWFLSGSYPFDLKKYFPSSFANYAPGLLIDLCNLAGAVQLFRLRKSAFYLLATAFIVSSALGIYQIIDNFATFYGSAGIMIATNCLIMIACIIYVKHLITKGILK